MRKYITMVMMVLLWAVSFSPSEAAPKPASPDNLKKEQQQPHVTSEADRVGDDEILGKNDENDEDYNLPDFAPSDMTAIGEMRSYLLGEEDTLLDVSRSFNLGYVEMRAANREIDPWTPTPGEAVLIPDFELLPRGTQKGILVNLGAMRLYHFYQSGQPPRSYPIGIGREGLQTPTGKTTITRKAAGPTWTPTERMRKEKPFLPVTVPAGPSNPLGTHALYLGWPTFLIHGTNKPWGIGRRLSSGCMRMYPEDIERLYSAVPVGTPVNIVDQPILVAWVGDTLYLEAHPNKHQSYELESSTPMTIDSELRDDLKELIKRTAGARADEISWGAVENILEKRVGYPVPIIKGPDYKEFEPLRFEFKGRMKEKSAEKNNKEEADKKEKVKDKRTEKESKKDDQKDVQKDVKDNAPKTVKKDKEKEDAKKAKEAAPSLTTVPVNRNLFNP